MNVMLVYCNFFCCNIVVECNFQNVVLYCMNGWVWVNVIDVNYCFCVVVWSCIDVCYFEVVFYYFGICKFGEG